MQPLVWLDKTVTWPALILLTPTIQCRLHFQTKNIWCLILKDNFTNMCVCQMDYPQPPPPPPRIFTRLMKPVFSALRKKGHQIMGYLDDSFLMGDTFEECEKAVVASVELLTKLGFQIHPEKSRLLPVQVIEYLGFWIDSVTMTVRLTPLKRQKVLSIISEIISSKSLLIRDLAKLLGTLESTLPGVQFGRLHMWHLQQDKNEALRNSQGKLQ